MIRHSGIKHVHVYSRIQHIFQSGMTDMELQVEIERVSRLEGCLGQFRISGDSMELYMGNVLVGDNADAPSPMISQWEVRDWTRRCQSEHVAHQ